MIHVRLPQNIRREIRLLCADKDITIQSYLVNLIERDLIKRKQKGGDKKK